MEINDRQWFFFLFMTNHFETLCSAAENISLYSSGMRNTKLNIFNLVKERVLPNENKKSLNNCKIMFNI